MLKGISVGLFLLFFLTGYSLNVIKLVRSDFKPPYKSEVIRGVGVVVPFIGITVGYMTIENNKGGK